MSSAGPALVVGANGATGRLLVEQLLERGVPVRALVRSPDSLPESATRHPNLSVVRASIAELTVAELAPHVAGCRAVASCLGHNLTWRGVFGRPRRLVTDATRRLCAAVRVSEPRAPVRFVLMNTAGNRDRDEPVSFAQRCVLGLLRVLVPPHADNEQAADHLRVEVGPDDPSIEWSVVRPDTLIDADRVGSWSVHASPTRSAIFDPGRTSRVHVGHFMAELICDDALWSAWRGRMPVLYDAE